MSLIIESVILKKCFDRSSAALPLRRLPGHLLELLVDLRARVDRVALDLLALRAEALALRAGHLRDIRDHGMVFRSFQE